MTRKATILILIILITFSLNSCSLFFRVFIRNFSDQPLELKFPRGYEEFPQDKVQFGYADELIKINEETLTYLNKRGALKIDQKEVTLTIPPRSTFSLLPFLSSDTLYLETNIRKLGIKPGRQAILIQDGIIKDSLDIVNFGRERKFKKKGALLVKALYYYDYKQPTRH